MELAWVNRVISSNEAPVFSKSNPFLDHIVPTLYPLFFTFVSGSPRGGDIIYFEKNPQHFWGSLGVKVYGLFRGGTKGRDPMDKIIATNHKRYNQNKKTNYIVTKIISETQGW